jgi:hypothetical protein
MTEESANMDDASAVAEAVNGAADGEAEATWHYADGVAGQGDKPEWYKADKYANITEQAKAYTELESKFGAFTGAPEAYEINVSDQLKEGGVDINAEDPIMDAAMEFAKSINMDQKGFDSMVELYGMAKLAEDQALETLKANELNQLGPNASARMDNLNMWASANLPEDLMQSFQNMATDAGSVQALEKLVAMTRSAPVVPPGDPAPGGATEEEVKEMQFELDSHGNRRINTDPAFRKEYEKKLLQVYGGEDHRIVVGVK